MRKKWKVRKAIIERIAKKRIRHLIKLAKEKWGEDKQLAKRYVQLAFAILKKTKVKLDVETKFSFCRKCFVPWVESNVEKRQEEKFIVYKCLNCGYVRRRFCCGDYPVDITSFS
jgi:ribonuclease P protein subunit RPR2